MYLKFLSPAYIVTCALLCLSIIIQKIFMSKLKNSAYPALIAVLLIFYVLISLLLFIAKFEPIMFLFAISPFIIGKLATYKTENLYSLLQIFCILLSAFLVGGGVL